MFLSQFLLSPQVVSTILLTILQTYFSMEMTWKKCLFFYFALCHFFPFFYLPYSPFCSGSIFSIITEYQGKQGFSLISS